MAGKKRSVRVEYMELGSLVRWPRNPKDHDVGAIHQSINRFGFIAPFLIDETSGRIVAGHGRLDTLEQQQSAGNPPPDYIHEKNGKWMVPVIRGIAFESEMEAQAYLLTDNRTTELGGWHLQPLSEVLLDLVKNDALVGVGWDQDDVQRLLRDLEGGDKSGQYDPSTLPDAGGVAPDYSCMLILTFKEREALRAAVVHMFGEEEAERRTRGLNVRQTIFDGDAWLAEEIKNADR